MSKPMGFHATKNDDKDLRRITRTVLPGRSEKEYDALAASHANSLAGSLEAWRLDSD